jgi:tetratricopeptide (TPR) repeat protein
MNVNWTEHRCKIMMVLTAAHLLTGAIAHAHPHHPPQPPAPPPVSKSALISAETPRQATAALHREIAFYQARIRTNPEDGLDRAALASLYVQMAKVTGDDHWYEQAAQTAQDSLARLPFANQGAQLVLARVAEAKHEFAETLRLTTLVLQEQPTHPDALALQVTTYLAQGQLDAADRTVQALIEKTPTLGTLTLRALVYEAQGQDQAALQAFQQALTLQEPDDSNKIARIHTLLGRFYARRGELAVAEEQYQAALQVQPHSPLARLHLAELNLRQGRLPAAAELYTQLYSDPAAAQGLEHDALYGMAQVKVLQGDRQAAEILWHQAETHLREDHAEGSFGHRRDLAQLLLARGNRDDLPEALRLMEAEVQNRRDSQTLDTLAWALSRVERWQDAQKALQAAIDLGTREAGIFYRAGTVAKALGRKDAAISHFQKAQAINPTLNQRDLHLLGITAGTQP